MNGVNRKQRGKFLGFHIYILRFDNDFDDFIIAPEKSGRLLNFNHRGHKYHFDPEFSFIVHQPMTVRYWLSPSKLQVFERMILYRETDSDVPIEPLAVPAGANCIEESPIILKGVTRSKVLARYRMKQKFGRFGMPPAWMLVVIAIFVVIALLIFTKTIHVPGINIPSSPRG